MLSKIKNIIRKKGSDLLYKFIKIDNLSKKIFSLKYDNILKNCESQVMIGKESKFYEESKVFNAQGDKEKIKIGYNTHVRGQLLIFKYGGEIQIGDNCYVGDGTRIWSGDSIIIGNNVLISHNVSIVDTNSHELDYCERSDRYIDLIKNGPWETKGSIITKSILIKDNAWISFGAIILKGVKIGEGAIVAAGAVVTKDVPDFAVVAGNPARVVKKL